MSNWMCIDWIQLEFIPTTNETVNTWNTALMKAPIACILNNYNMVRDVKTLPPKNANQFNGKTTENTGVDDAMVMMMMYNKKQTMICHYFISIFFRSLAPKKSAFCVYGVNMCVYGVGMCVYVQARVLRYVLVFNVHI